MVVVCCNLLVKYHNPCRYTDILLTLGQQSANNALTILTLVWNSFFVTGIILILGFLQNIDFIVESFLKIIIIQPDSRVLPLLCEERDGIKVLAGSPGQAVSGVGMVQDGISAVDS